jgi:dTDP-glucose 4,6-dehydratase
MSAVVVTGSRGFIGSHFLEYAGFENAILIDRPEADLRGECLRGIADVDAIFHFAARMRMDGDVPASEYVLDNILGTTNLLEAARRIMTSNGRFINFNSVEALGDPSSPYAASKAAAAYMGRAFYRSHRLPVINVFCTNCFGERQNRKNFVPAVVRAVMKKQIVGIYADATGNSGSRIWTYAKNAAAACIYLYLHGRAGEPYTIFNGIKLTNLEMAERIAAILDLPLDAKLINANKERPGYDFQYAPESLPRNPVVGWLPPFEFESSLRQTVNWYRDEIERAWNEGGDF